MIGNDFKGMEAREVTLVAPPKFQQIKQLYFNKEFPARYKGTLQRSPH